MSISLLLIGAISVVVIAGTAYLFSSKNEQLSEQKKATILMIVGAVIFLSFMVTTFKHRQINFYSNPQYEGSLNVEKIFFGDGCNYLSQRKYQQLGGLSAEMMSEIYGRNYLSLNEAVKANEELKEWANEHQQMVVFLSKKDEGASYFLADQAQRYCQERKPVVYLKLTNEVNSEEDLVRLIGIHSFEQLQKHLCHYSGIEIKHNKYQRQFVKRGGEATRPYLIIDNFEYLLSALTPLTPQPVLPERSQVDDQEVQYPRTERMDYHSRQRVFSKIMNDLVGQCGVNIILNTEKQTAIGQLYQIWEERSDLHSESSIFPFEYHRWQGLKQYDVYKIVAKGIPNSQAHISKILQATKKERYSFREFAIIYEDIQQSLAHKDSSKSAIRNREQAALRDFGMKLSVARYFRLQKLYKLLKNSENRRVGHLRTKADLFQLEQLELLGLVQINGGVVNLK